MSDSSDHRPGHATAWFGLVIVVAVVLRAAALAMASGHLADDRDDYLAVARHYVDYGFWHSFQSIPDSFRPPLFPLVVAVLIKAGGGSAALGVLQLVLGTATVVLTWHIGRRLDLGRLAIVAAGLVALDPLLVEYTTFPMTETLFTFLVTLFVALATPNSLLKYSPVREGEAPAEPNCAAKRVKMAQQELRPPILQQATKTREAAASHISTARAAALGVVFGACALCRPTIWTLGGLLAIWLLVRAFRKTEESGRLMRGGLAAVLGTVVVVAPWVLRNWHLLGSPVLTTTHGGYTLLLGNNEAFFHEVAARSLWEEWHNSTPDRFQQAWFGDLVADMNREMGPNPGELANDRWMYRRAWRDITAQPRLFLRACLFRFAEFWNVVPLAPSRSALGTAVVWSVGIGYSLEFVLFLIGLASLFRRWDARWMLPLLLILNFTLVHLVYWSNMRMRAPLVPLIALIAARGIGEFTRTSRETAKAT